MRRVLLGATTALLAARMLAPGEDPGSVQPAAGATNLFLVLLWLLAAVALAGWRLWSRRGDWRGGVVETALLAAAVLAFVSAETAGYKHPARLIAWDWLVLFVVVCLIRQLAVTPDDQRAMLGVFLAGAAALSFQAVYQRLALGAPASASFARPEPFVPWLALFLPGLVVAAVLCRPGRALRWQTIFTTLFALRGAAALAAAVWSVVCESDPTSIPLSDVWRPTLGLVRDHPWLGVGAGNFSRAFAGVAGPNGGAPVSDPHDFALEIAATFGVFMLLLVLLAFGAFFARAGRRLFDKNAADAEPLPRQEAAEQIGWEYNLGGMCGLVLGFILRMLADDYTQAQVLTEGGVACARCLVWLTAFVLFERIPWSGRARVAALVLGVAASLLTMLASPGIGVPPVSVALWAAVALGLNGLPQPSNAWLNRYAAARILALPAAGLAALLFFLNVFNPVAGSAEQVEKTALPERMYLRDLRDRDPRRLPANEVQAYSKFLDDKVFGPLKQAALDDPDDAGIRVRQARWGGVLWTIRATDGELARAAVHYAQVAQRLDPQGREGYDAEYQLRMEFGRRLEGVGYLPGLAIGPTYRIFLKEGRWPNPAGREAIEKAKAAYQAAVQSGDEANAYEPAIQYFLAAGVLERYRPYDPNDTRLRFQLAEAYFKAWEDALCLEQAEEALRLDAAAPRPVLTEEQRRKLNVWKRLPVPSGPGA